MKVRAPAADTMGSNLFVAIEGTDGAGKTTIRRWLYRVLHTFGMEALAVRQNSWLDTEATRVITTARFLGQDCPPSQITDAYVRDKELLSTRIIERHLGYRHVISDRYVLSDIVYHDSIFGIPPATTYSAYAASIVRMPDLIVHVDTPMEVALPRLFQRSTRQLKRWDAERTQRDLYERFHRVLSDGEFGGLGEVLHVDNGGSLDSTFAQLESELLPRFLETA